MTDETLDPDEALRIAEAIWEVIETQDAFGGANPELVTVLSNGLRVLDDDARRRFMRGKRATFWRTLYSSAGIPVARSTAYAHKAGAAAGGGATRAGTDRCGLPRRGDEAQGPHPRERTRPARTVLIGRRA